MRLRKAVFPVAGMGTRFLPATKALPKEMLPVVDKPLIQYAVEEAQAAGIEEFVFVTGRNKTAIEDHFDHSFELNHTLATRGKHSALETVTSWMPKPGKVAYTRQQEPLGLGHAVWCARHFVGDEPFAVLLADDLVLSKTPCLKQMTDTWSTTGGNMVAVMDVPREHTNRYGILDVASDNGKLAKVKGLVEKPDPAFAPSTLSIIGRYILQPSIFAALENQARGAGGAGGAGGGAFTPFFGSFAAASLAVASFPWGAVAASPFAGVGGTTVSGAIVTAPSGVTVSSQ